MAPLLPKLRGHFAEFLNNASPVGLGLLDLSTCVGLRYGSVSIYSGFSRRPLHTLRYYFSLRITYCLSPGGFAFPAGLMLAPCFLSGLVLPFRVPTFSIAYASPPRLRSRLTQGRSALPWNPRTSGLDDSHIHLATHSGILSPVLSTAPSGTASSCTRRSPTSPEHTSVYSYSAASAACLSPVYFRRGASRLVSYYALFECVAASEPTS